MLLCHSDSNQHMASVHAPVQHAVVRQLTALGDKSLQP